MRRGRCPVGRPASVTFRKRASSNAICAPENPPRDGSKLDVVTRVKARFGQPTAAYQVSGEYSMIKAAAERGWIDHDRAVLETLTGIRRAGADLIVTYFARHAARLLA